MRLQRTPASGHEQGKQGETMGVKQWNVRVMREGQAQHIGQVAEDSEALARCAALSLYGVTEDEVDAGEVRERGAFIYPDEDFEVSPAG